MSFSELSKNCSRGKSPKQITIESLCGEWVVLARHNALWLTFMKTSRYIQEFSRSPLTTEPLSSPDIMPSQYKSNYKDLRIKIQLKSPLPSFRGYKCSQTGF